MSEVLVLALWIAASVFVIVWGCVRYVRGH